MKKITLFLIVIGCIFCAPAVKASTTLMYSCYGSSCTISVDLLYKASISELYEQDTYYFSPQSSDYYVVETYGDLDMYMIRYDNGYTYTNDDGGEKLNSNMGFIGNAGETYTFYISSFSNTPTGDYYIQVRRQMASIVTFDYGPGDIDTRPDSVTPKSELIDRGYYVIDYKNYSESSLIADDFTGLSRLNKEIVMFSGHGNKGFISLADSQYSKTYMYSSELPYMGNTKLAVWATCYSSSGNSIYNSIAEQSVINGSAVSIGWPDTTTVQSSRIFTNHLFSKLNDGSTVSSAASYAASKILFWFDNVKDYEIFGDGSRYIYQNVNNKQNSTSYIPLYTEFSYSSVNNDGYNVSNYLAYKEIQNKYYIESLKYEIDNEVVERYYTTINGKITNEYFDILRNSKRIVNSSKIKITQSDIDKLGKHSFDDFTLGKLNQIVDAYKNYQLYSVEIHDLYIKMNNNIEPVKVYIVDLYNETTGESISVIKSYNILNGQEIDYYSFAFED